MSSESQEPSKYRIEWLADALSQVRELKTRAIQDGRLASQHFALQLRTIMRALEFVPLEWGEAINDVSTLELTNCAGFHERIAVNYGVHQEHRIVFVRSIRILSGHPLSEE